jgi:hypothetical protein
MDSAGACLNPIKRSGLAADKRKQTIAQPWRHVTLDSRKTLKGKLKLAE